MPKPAQYVRKVKKGDSVNVYSKSFNVDEKGLRKAQKYEKNSSTNKVSGERLNCKIDKNNKSILVYTPTNFPLPHFKIIGTTSLSRVKGTYSNTGAFYKGFGDIIQEIAESISNLKELNIDYTKDSETTIRKYRDSRFLTISEKDYNYMHGLFQTEKKLSSDNSKVEIIKYLQQKVPDIEIEQKKSREIVSRDFKNLIFKQVLNDLTDKEVKNLLFQLYDQYYEVIESKVELFKETDTYKLDYIISEYERYFKEFSSDESMWQQFFEENFSIINPSYKYVIREVDTIFNALDIEADKRPVDFIVVDIYNNVELIELKTPSSPIISSKKDRNNYYLVHNCTKACTQLEKYLLCFERNHSEVEKLVKRKIFEKYGIRQKDINLLTTKPKAKLIIGKLDPITKKKSRHQDFQLQRHSFKNIELITYDEILKSLKEIKRELDTRKKK
ncbi:MAG TPA: Shedu immune nuclease family protein [Salinimicrobium sp.]|nr:Shedu immune nuclease family protein [Salinimicrobium sp.]